MNIKKFIMTLALLLLYTVANSMILKKTILILSPDDEKINKNNYKIYDVFKPKDVLIYNNYIYVLDGNDSFVYYFDMNGVFKGKFGGMGGGPKELYSPASMEIVGDDLWVMDFNNSRIQIYHNNIHKKSIKFRGASKIIMPHEIALLGNDVFISSISIRPGFFGIAIFDKNGIYKKKLMLSSKILSLPKSMSRGPWYGVKLETISKSKLLIGFKSLPVIALIVKNTSDIRYVDMSKYYSRHEDKRGNMIFPSGFTATAFSAGPENTILIAVCNDKKKRCNILTQFSSDLSKKISEIVTDFHIWGIKYYPDRKTIIFITGDGEVRLYETN